MSDKYSALTVVLDNEYRQEDIEELSNAISLLKGVISVSPLLNKNMDIHIARMQVRNDLREKMFNLWDTL